MKEELPIGLCYERCPYCGEEVIIHKRLDAHECPECGKWFVNCSMCLEDTEQRHYCSECIAHFVAEGRNKECEMFRKMREEHEKGTDDK